jgi:hypothetical protein
VNGQVAATSGRYRLEWPGMEVKLQEKFELFLFSKPQSLKLEVLNVSEGVAIRLL